MTILRNMVPKNPVFKGQQLLSMVKVKCISIQPSQFRSHSTSAEKVELNEKPLAGYRVLDLSRVLAGPYCTMLLGDLGAEVIKIEHPERGDDTRAWGPPYAPYKIDISNSENPENSLKSVKYEGESAYFLCVNRNKKSVTVNIGSKEGQEIIIELAKKSDVLVENFIPGKLEKFGLSYEQLRKVNDRLVYASVTGYGRTGPYSKKPGYDVMIEAEAGLMHITGEKAGPPVKVGVAVTDLTTGLYTKGAILAALLSRSKTNKGQHIDVSLLRSQIATLANIGSNYLIGDVEASRWGSSHPSIVPYRNYETKTGPVCIGGGNDKLYGIFVNCLGLGELVSDPRFKTNTLRVKNRKEMDKIIQDKISIMTREEVLQLFEGKGIPIAPVNNMEQTFSHPQVIAQKMVSLIKHPAIGDIKLVGPAVEYSETPLSIYSPPPMLGQHTKSVLSEVLELSNEKISSLCKTGAISTFNYGF
ncbi:hypothetical protein BB560_004183 [Smittium megazygosporum]|uniref:Uncharacterized protein n=1 Tax=Smittium megazygosporum TaxID=133381 RepID=A0A2T9ZA44_9FUNG|nr:hypothetical protein BB560_004183 [Smittium megazygosporum]